jgi:PleD family two-component response regulator
MEDYSIWINEQCINITVSIGVTVWEMNDQFNDIYRRVDEALYEAKKTRNTIVVKTKTTTNDNEW